MRKKIIGEKIPVDCKQHMKAFNDTQYVLSGKWKVMIIGCLASGKKKFLELQRVVEGIGAKMLSKELQQLELNGLVTRTVLNTKPITVEYELTEYGHSLQPIINEMSAWGIKHRERIVRQMSAK